MRGLGIGIVVTALLMGVATGKGIPLSDAEIKARASELGMVESGSVKLTDLAGTPAPEGMDENGGNGASGEAGEPFSPSGDGAEATAGNAQPDGSDGAGGNAGNGAPNDSDGPGGNGAPNDSDGPGGNTGNMASGGSDGASAGNGGPGGSGGTDGSGDSGGVAGTDGSYAPEDGTGSGGESDRTGEKSSGDTVTVVIEFGVTSYHVSEILAEAGLVEDADKFDECLCTNGLSRNITAGTYESPQGASEEEIIGIITKNN